MKTATVTLLACIVFPFSLWAHERNSDTRGLIDSAMHAMGGRELLQSIGTVRIQANGQRNFLEQSIRPEGPWVIDMYRLDLGLDFGKHRLISKQTRTGQLGRLGPPVQDQAPVEYAVAEGIAATRTAQGFQPYPRLALQEADEILAFNPLRILFTAEKSRDLELKKDEMLHGMPQHVLAWSNHGIAVKLYLDATSHLPSAVTWTAPRPLDIYWHGWGDVATLLDFENWDLRPNGLRIPTQWNTIRNGLPETTLQQYALELNPVLDEQAWAFDSAIREQIKQLPPDIDAMPLGRQGQPAAELAPGIIKIPGNWDVTLVRQEDGVVVLEAPISNAYSALVLREAKRRFPDLPVKAVVSTTDAWPHIAGLREYVAAGIPIYIVDLNQVIVRRLLAAPHTLRPDALQRAPKPAQLRLVSNKLTIGEGTNRIELLPMGERMMIAWLPEQKLMYTSDRIQTWDKNWWPADGLQDLQTRFEWLNPMPERCFGMHYPVTPCAELRQALQTYLAPQGGIGQEKRQASSPGK